MLTLTDSQTQAITTRYVGPGNVRGSRITATSASGIRATVHYNDALSSWENHAEACRALCAKLGWFGNWISGTTRDGYVFIQTARIRR